MFPVIELKGAIPVGMNVEFWGENALDGTRAFLFSLLGSCLIVPILALVFKPLIKWLKSTRIFRKIGTFLDNKVKKHSASLVEKTDNLATSENKTKKTWMKFLGVFAFVCVPLPLTGVWTGTCVAVAVGLNFWQTCLSVILGNIVAGLIITTICAIFPQFTTILFLIILAFVLMIIIYSIIKMLLTKKDNKDNNEQSEEVLEDNKVDK